MGLTPIAPQQIGFLWDWIRKGLEVVRGKRPACTWLPEDVYHELMTGQAHLYVIGAEDGFVVVKRCVNTYERVMFIWAMWATPGSLLPHRKQIISELDNLARSAGLDRIRMDTTRDAEWSASKLFVPVSTVFEREVSP